MKRIEDILRDEYLAEGLAMGMAKGMKKGLEKGTQQTQQKIAAALLALGIPTNQILEATKIPMADLQNLMVPQR